MMEDKQTDETQNEDGASPYSDLQSSFESQDLESRDRLYDVDEADELLKKLKDALSKSENGVRLLQVADEYNIEIKLVKSKKIQSSVNGTKELFLSAESGQKDIKLPQLLEFGGALREIEQNIVGYGMPSEDEDPFERATRIHTKFLDKIVFMCKIGNELEIVYGDEIQKVINTFGFIDIYNAYVNKMGDDDIDRIYIETQNEGKV